MLGYIIIFLMIIWLINAFLTYVWLRVVLYVIIGIFLLIKIYPHIKKLHNLNASVKQAKQSSSFISIPEDQNYDVDSILEEFSSNEPVKEAPESKEHEKKPQIHLTAEQEERLAQYREFKKQKEAEAIRKEERERARKAAEDFFNQTHHFYKLSVANVTMKNKDGIRRQKHLESIYENPVYKQGHVDFKEDGDDLLVMYENVCIGTVPVEESPAIKEIENRITRIDITINPVTQETGKLIYLAELTIAFTSNV